MYTFSGALAL